MHLNANGSRSSHSVEIPPLLLDTWVRSMRSRAREYAHFGFHGFYFLTELRGCKDREPHDPDDLDACNHALEASFPFDMTRVVPDEWHVDVAIQVSHPRYCVM